jgi:hypothetical protein
MFAEAQVDPALSDDRENLISLTERIADSNGHCRAAECARALIEVDAGDLCGCIVERLEASHRGAALVDRPVVLLDEAIELLVRANCELAPASVFAPQRQLRSPTRYMAIQRHLPRDPRSGRRERFAKERLCGGNATVTAK